MLHLKNSDIGKLLESNHLITEIGAVVPLNQGCLERDNACGKTGNVAVHSTLN